MFGLCSFRRISHSNVSTPLGQCRDPCRQQLPTLSKPVGVDSSLFQPGFQPIARSTLDLLICHQKAVTCSSCVAHGINHKDKSPLLPCLTSAILAWPRNAAKAHLMLFRCFQVSFTLACFKRSSNISIGTPKRGLTGAEK